MPLQSPPAETPSADAMGQPAGRPRGADVPSPRSDRGRAAADRGHPPFRPRLGRRILIALVLTGVLPVAITAYLTWREHERALRAEAFGRARQVAQLLANNVDHFLRALQVDLQVVAETPAFRSAAVRGDWRAAQRALDVTARHHPAFRGVGLADAAGTMRAGTGSAAGLLGVDVSKRPNFAGARAQRRLVVTDLFPGGTASRLTIGIAIPIMQGDRIAAVLGAGVDLSRLTAEVQRVRVGGTGFATVQTGDGRIIVHPDPSRILQLAAEPTRAETLRGGGATGALETTRPDGTKDLTGFATVPTTGWVVLTHIPAKEALASLTTARQRLVTLLGLLLLMVGASAALYGRRLARPMNQLAEAARAVGAGELDRRVPFPRNDEIGEVGRAFNEMADRRQQAEAALQVSLARRDALTMLSAAIASGTDRAGIVRQVVEATARLLGAPYAVLWTPDPQGARLIPAAEFVDPSLGPLPPQPALPANASLAGAVPGGRNPLAVPDVRGHPDWANQAWPGLQVLGSYLGLHLETGGGPVGILDALDRPGRTFTSEEIELLRSLGTHAALALEKAELLANARESYDELTAIHEATQAIVQSLDLRETLRRILSAAMHLTGTDKATIWLLDEDRQDLVGTCVVGAGEPGELHLPLSAPSLSAACLREGRILVSHNPQEDPRCNREVQRRFGSKTVVTIPLRSAQQIVGVLDLADLKRVHHFDPREIAILERLAGQAVVAIQKARLFQSTRETAEEIAALYAAGQAIAENLDLHATLGRIAEAARRLNKADRIFIWLVAPRDGSLEAGIALGQGAENFVGTRLPADSPATAARAVREGRTIAVPDALDPAFADPGLSRQFNNAALLAAPLRFQETVHGVLVCGYDHPQAFAAAEVNRLASLAQQAAIAIQNARLFQRERDHSRQVDAVRAVAAEITRELDLPALLGLITRRAVELLGAGSGAVYLWDEAAQCLLSQAWHGRGDWMRGVRFRLGEGFTGTVAQRRAGMLINDAQDYPFASPVFQQRPGVTACLAEPLLYRDRLLGVLTVDDCGVGRPFTPQDQETLALFAAQAAIAIENARLFETISQREEHLRTLLKTNQKIGALVPLDALLESIAEEAARLLGVEGAGFRLLEGDDLVLAATWGESRAAMQRPRLRRDESLSGWIVTHGQPLLLADVREFPGFIEEHRQAARRLGHKAFLGVPLKIGERITGVLTLRAKGERRFTDTDVQLATAFADQAALAIENVRLHEDVRRRAEEATALAEVARALNVSLDQDQVLESVVEGVYRVMGGAFTGIMTLDEERQELTYAKAAGLSREHVAGLRLKVGEGIAGQAVAEAAPAQTARLLQDPRYVDRGVAEAQGLRSLLCVPVLAGGRPLGALALFRRDEHEFSPGEVQLLARFADQAAIAIQNARLYQQEQRRRQQVEAVRTVAEEITRELDLDPLLGLIHRRAAELVGAISGAIWLWDEAGQALVPRAWTGLPAGLKDARLRLGEGIAGLVAQRREGLIVNDYRTSPYASPALRALSRSTAVLAEPLLYRDRLLGVIVITNHEGVPTAFTTQDRASLALFAAQAAIAIENARLYELAAVHAQTLEQRVRERTAELEKANRAKSEFLANMSHELRTPLNAIIGFADLLRMPSFGPLTPKQQKYVGNIQAGGVHLLNLVNDVLDLARVEAGRMELRRERIAVATAIAEALEGFRPQAERKGLTVACEAEPDLPAVYADPVRFRQILGNLLSNAVKFTEPGGHVTVRVARAQAAVPAAEWVEIGVADTGIGIAPEDLGRLFRKFEQLEGGLAKAHQGTGLGLALTRQLVELHGGSIAARSAGRGLGSTFTVRLPIGPHRERPLVLAVDDDPGMRELLACSLREWGWEAATAATLAEARAALDRERPDLVILDAALPDGSGTDFVREIRQGPAARVAILLFTGLGAEEGQAALKMGADDYLVKPAPGEAIYRKASKLLAQSAWSGVVRAPGQPEAGISIEVADLPSPPAQGARG